MDTPKLQGDKVVETKETPKSEFVAIKQQKIKYHQEMRDTYEAMKLEEQRQIDFILEELNGLL